jgi:thiamine biosynthesis lipoprotein
MISRRQALFGCTALALAPRDAVSATRPATAFGTTVRLTVKAKSQEIAEHAIDLGFAEIRKIEKAFNLFDPDSEVSRLNASGELHHPSAMMLELVQLSNQLHELSQGAFDPTVQPLWLAWIETRRQSPSVIASRCHLPHKGGGLERSATLMLPPCGGGGSRSETERDFTRVGWSNLISTTNHLSLQNRAALTFNGIAQGYAADRVMTAIKPFAFSSVIDTGEYGLTESQTLTIRNPRKPEPIGTLKASPGFIASSGDYATSFTPDFRHHHIFDPATGDSPQELAGVTVLAPTGAMADGLATAFMVMGHEKSLALCERLKGVSAIFISKSNNIVLSSRMKDQFTPS